MAETLPSVEGGVNCASSSLVPRSNDQLQGLIGVPVLVSLQFLTWFETNGFA